MPENSPYHEAGAKVTYRAKDWFFDNIHYLLCEALRTLCALRGKIVQTAEGAKVTQSFAKETPNTTTSCCSEQPHHFVHNNHVMLFRILSDDTCVFVAFSQTTILSKGLCGRPFTTQSVLAIKTQRHKASSTDSRI